MCALCTLLLCPGHFVLQASHLQSLSLLWAVFSPWPKRASFDLGVLWFACEMIPVSTTAETEAPQNTRNRRHSVSRNLVQSSGGRDSPLWDWDKCDWEEQFYQGVGGGVRPGISKWPSEFWHCASSPRWPCAYAEGYGREMVTASSFVLREVSVNAASL